MTQANRLALERSPYLLQHAHDPVDWHPWGEEAFDRARREDKPIFLSIGYSTCHWCHVMEQESFADEETARLLNTEFVAIKVDREERPDLDQYYMAFCQSLTGAGGWPLTIMMTPDRQPFFAGTYYPRSRRFGRPGLLELLPTIGEAWRTKRPEILRSAVEVSAAVERGTIRLRRQRGDKLTAATLDEAFRELAADFDRARGGFGGAPKFPIAHHIGFLLRYWQRTDKGEALGMAGKTLKAMRRGGIFDHLGFGFHRYSTDADWLVPHFEKMLYDQALLAEVYAQAFAATGRTEFEVRPRRSRITSSGIWPHPQAVSIRPRTPTAKARRASSISGRGRSSTGYWAPKTPGSQPWPSGSARPDPQAGPEPPTTAPMSSTKAGFRTDRPARRGAPSRPRKRGSNRSVESSFPPETSGRVRSRIRRSSPTGTA